MCVRVLAELGRALEQLQAPLREVQRRVGTLGTSTDEAIAALKQQLCARSASLTHLPPFPLLPFLTALSSWYARAPSVLWEVGLDE